MNREVTIPDIGDAEDVEVIEICVSPGESVAENDALIVIESDKASMEVPAPFAGTVAEVLVALTDRVNAGDAILRMRAADSEPAPSEAPAEDSERESAPVAPSTTQPAEAQPPTTPPTPTPAPAPPAESEPGDRVYAGPAVRRLARELGVDLRSVTGTARGGRIVKDDVKAFVKGTLAAPEGPRPAPMDEVDYSRFGDIEVKPLSRTRARGAANLQRSWRQVVHVTQHDDADVTDLEDFRASLREEVAARSVKLTPLPFVIKACVHALKAHPQFNASLDAGVTALIHKRYYHIGIAVDTNDGLIVPVLRNADRLGLLELAAETARLADAARRRRLKPDETQGGSFTVSSLGNLGGTGFTPIVNAPEVAILGVARLQTRPQWDGTAFQPRKVLPLSLSYDHRAINGAEAGRFVADVGKLLGDIRRMTL